MTARILVTLFAVAGLAVPGTLADMPPAEGLRLAQAASPLPIPSDNTASGIAATPAPPPAPEQPDMAAPDDGMAATPDDDGDTPDQPLSLGEIPTIETVELTPDIAKRALDSYIAAKEKYADSDLDQYENLQDFVDKTEDGKKFEADVKAAGFANVSDWNLAVTTLGITYVSISDDQSSELEQQIKEIEEDKELAQDMKDKMVKALKALIPSDNNRKILQDLMNDPVYGTKLKQLDIEEE